MYKARHMLTGEIVTAPNRLAMAKLLGHNDEHIKNCLKDNLLTMSGYQIIPACEEWTPVTVDRKTVLRCGEYRARKLGESTIVCGKSINDVTNSIRILFPQDRVTASSLHHTMIDRTMINKSGWSVECVWGRFVVRSKRFKSSIIVIPGEDGYTSSYTPEAKALAHYHRTH